MHFTSVALLDTKQVSHVQEPGSGANVLRRLLLGSICFSVCFVCNENENPKIINILYTILVLEGLIWLLTSYSNLASLIK